MDKLKAENLFGGALVQVAGALADRYNQCLKMIGEEPTKLRSFSVDGIGWSPEIAEEKEELYYLNNGEANPHAIIISPNQENKPVYVPFHSFDEDIMKLIFETNKIAINDITKDGGICVDLDQFIDAFYEPFDLLKYQNISIGFKLVNDLDVVQQQQFELIGLFNEGNNFIDEEIHIQLLASSRKYGDLRKRKLTLKPISFKTDSFYTKAFGGVFVLRDFVKPMLIFESKDWHKKAIADTIHDVLIYHINDKALIEKLLDDTIIANNLEEVVKTDRYQRIKKFMLAEQLKETSHEIKDILNDQILFKSYLNKVDISSRNRIMGIERYIEKRERETNLKIQEFVESSFFNALCEPHPSLIQDHQELVWNLLVKIAPKDPLYLYWYDKEIFYREYKKWNVSYQYWIIDCIKEQFKK